MFGVDRDVLAMLKTLGDRMIEARDHARRTPGLDADALAVWINVKLNGWSPRYKGAELADGPTRQAAARFLAGVALALARADREAA